MSKAPAIVASAVFGAFFRPPKIAPSTWAKHLVVPDGPRAGEQWDIDLTAYIKEPLDFQGPESSHNEIAVMKSAQTGFTTMMIAAVCHSMECDRCDMAILQPTDQALADFNRLKLQPAIESTKRLAACLNKAESTTYSKVLTPRGSLALLIASSAADLRSKTLKKLYRDEIDQYPDDLDGQGDPLNISDGRLFAFLDDGTWRKVDVSTPTIKGGSKIEQRHEAGDQRRWHVTCPHCTRPDGSPSEFVFENGPHFRFERTFPYKAHYITPCCGVVIENFEKRGLVRAGRWIATAPRPGAFPSYHFDTFSSPFVPWDAIAKAIVEAGDDPLKLKSLWNLWFGLPFEVKGDAPDHVRLMERREEGVVRYRVPPRGLMLVAAADVQMRGIWYEILAVAPDRQSWVVDAGYCDGGTESPDSDAFKLLLSKTVDRTFEDAFGRPRTLDALAVDSGYRSHVVYAFVRANQRIHPETGEDVILAVDGRDGWGKPAIGTPSLVDIDLAGQKVRKGCKLWPVGTWPLKGAFYADLRKEGIRSGAEADPSGYCHFGTWQDEAYFRQITAEYIADEKVKGRARKVWKIKASQRDNHLLDCRVYNLATAEYLGLSSTTPAEWAALARRRGLPDDLSAIDLFKPRSAPSPVAPADTPGPAGASPVPASVDHDDEQRAGWLGARGSFWGR